MTRPLPAVRHCRVCRKALRSSNRRAVCNRCGKRTCPVCLEVRLPGTPRTCGECARVLTLLDRLHADRGGGERMGGRLVRVPREARECVEERGC